MTPLQFCYWLSGFFEIKAGEVVKGNHFDSLNQNQLNTIKFNLDMVLDLSNMKASKSYQSVPPRPLEILEKLRAV